MSVGLLFDATLCIGCGACEAACKEANELPGEVEERTTAYTWTVVEQRGGVYVRRLCLHCLEPTCVSVCPVGALSKTRAGPVVYDPNLCIGCRYCIMACPFGVPKYQWDRSVPVVGKCVLCVGRLRNGLPPACASVCPTGATQFGEREQLLEDARSRIAREPGRYVPHVYGSEEVGGTSVLLLSSVPFERLGLPEGLPRDPLPLRTWQVLSKIPDFVLLAGVFLYGLFWITRRREEVREAEDRSRKEQSHNPPRGGGASRRSSKDLSP